MMDKLAAGHIDDLRRTAERSRRPPRRKSRRHPGTTVARMVGVSLIRVGRRLAGPDVRHEPGVLTTAREAMGELPTLT
jgi:hypothetical protein